MDVDVKDTAISKARREASYARDNLTVVRNNKHHPKVCCICDKFIIYGEECTVTLTVLKGNKINRMLKKNQNHLYSHYNVSAEAMNAIDDHYTVKCREKESWLRKLYLSPKSYFRGTINKLDYGLGACVACKNSLSYGKTKNEVEDRPPQYAIANGLMIGPTPKELRDLNDVEIAVISLARIDKHVFQIHGGAHQRMVGWHAMYANDVVSVSNTVNWCARNSDVVNNAEGTIESHSDESETDATNNNTDRRINEEDDLHKTKFAKICVILCGPFTSRQKAIATRKAKVDWIRLQKALQWLKKNNHLYARLNIDTDCMEVPIVIDKTESVESIDNNMEQIFEMRAVFPDGSNFNHMNGGCENRSHFKELTLERMMAESDKREATLITRPTTKILKDYQGENLMMAFPLQFPYGIGSIDNKKETRSGVGYIKHLMYMARLQNHRGDFVCVLHNMFERNRMIKNSFLRNKEDLREAYVGLTNAGISEAVERFTSGTMGSGLADTFLRKMKATTASMAHTEGAAKAARQKLFAMIAAFGLPALLFTITPVDDVNFRIRIYADETKDGIPNPIISDDTQAMRDFVVDSRLMSRHFPGLSALDFENVLRITIEHFLGWSIIEEKNKTDEGIFGDIVAFCSAVEEQGRGVLHSHILVWIKGWENIYNKMGSDNERMRKKYEDMLKKYATKIMTTKIFGENEKTFPTLCAVNCKQSGNGIRGMTKCNLQSIRNLRSKSGMTNLGEKDILFCNECNTGYTSEDLSAALLCRTLGRDKVLDNGIMPSYKAGLWERNGYVSKPFVHAEMLLLQACIPQTSRRRVRQMVTNSGILPVVGVLRNLHKTMHPQTCFKTKNTECRMKIPDSAKDKIQIHYDTKETRWFDWKGTFKLRKLFQLALARTHADMYANTHNEHVSSIFQCNNNVVACIGGGSPMYCTSYQSKNTQKEDNEKVGKAAKVMINRMTEKLQDEEILTKENLGIKTLIGAILLANDAHVCGAPMAAFLSRNGTRFWFSHQFSHTRLEDFFEEQTTDYQLRFIEEGNPLILSHVGNYTMRPLELEDISLYDFLCTYTVARRSKGSLQWFGNHPSKERLAVKKLPEGKERVPRVNFLDFVDAKLFEGEDIINCIVPGVKECRHYAMEEFSKKACVLFIPFRDARKDLMLTGSYHEKLRQHVRAGKLLNRHSAILGNIQNCRNSLNAGRPMDLLEQQTSAPPKSIRSNSEKDNDEIPILQMLEDLRDDEQILYGMRCQTLKNALGILNIASSQTTAFGTNSCGTKYCKIPTINITPNTSVIQVRDDQGSDVEIEHTVDLSRITTLALSELNTRQTSRTVEGDSNRKCVPDATGTLRNIREYADVLFKGDAEQKQAFECIVASFVLKIYNAASKNDPGYSDVPARKKRKLENAQHYLRQVNREDQLICFLSGAGGTGKSAVIKAVTSYSKKFCVNLGIGYNSRVVVVTAITGAAAVTIIGETTSKALGLNKRTTNFSDQEIENWKSALLVIIDEVSFSNKDEIVKADRNLRELKENADHMFGGVDVVFSGDFTQLAPVQGKAIYLEKDFTIWDEWVHTYFELKTNHRFKNDPNWGHILTRYRNTGPNEDDIKCINKRLVNSKYGPRENMIPQNITYATKTNADRMAINDGIFAAHIRATHFQDPSVSPPDHTICIKASDLRWSKTESPGKREYTEFNSLSKEILYACVGEAHIKSSGNSKTHDALLKLYYGRPLMINENLDVKKGIANGTMCEFQGLVLKGDVTKENLDVVLIDNYYVRCAECLQIESIKVKILDGLDSEDEVKIAYLKPHDILGARAFYPMPIFEEIDRSTTRSWRYMRMKQFPVSAANARTIHKLQGRSLENVLIHSWDYTGNWIYVALSRVKVMSGLFICQELNLAKCKGMSDELKLFMQRLEKKRPLERINRHDWLFE